MIRMNPVLLAAFGWALAGHAWAAANCKHAYEKVFPYDLPLGNKQAYINVHNEVRLSYDCKAALARAASEAKVGIFDLDLNLLQAEAKATAQAGQPATAGAHVLVLGYEVAREDIELADLINVSISPEPEVDVNGSLTLNVGPVPVPVKYGVTADVQLHIKGGTKGFGLALNLLPTAHAQVYVQAGVDIMIAQAVARGDVTLIDDALNTDLALLFEETDHGYLRFDAAARNSLQALEGFVFIRASAGIGVLKKTYEKDLLRWDGYTRDDLVFDYSERIAILD